MKNGRGSFELILRQIEPLLRRQRRMQVSARVTVTPLNLDLPATLDLFVGLGFHSVGFSPLLRAPNGQAELDREGLGAMLRRHDRYAAGQRAKLSLFVADETMARG